MEEEHRECGMIRVTVKEARHYENYISVEDGHTVTVISRPTALVWSRKDKTMVSLRQDEKSLKGFVPNYCLEKPTSLNYGLNDRVEVLKDFEAPSGLHKLSVSVGEKGTILNLIIDNDSGEWAKVRIDTGGEGFVGIEALTGEGGWPFEATESWHPAKQPGQPAGCREIRKGDAGEILKYSPNFEWTAIRNPTRGIEFAWVPTFTLKKGYKVRFSRPWRVIKQEVASKIKANIDAEEAAEFSDSATEMAVLAWLEALYTNRELVPALDIEVLPHIRDSSSRMDVAETIVTGIERAKLLEHFNDDDVTLDDILDTADRAEDTDEMVLYLRAYAKFNKTKIRNRLTTIYGGVATNSSRRAETHRINYTNPNIKVYKSMHGAVYRAATVNENRVLCLLPPGTSDSVSAIAEQTILLLIGTYRPELEKLASEVVESQEIARVNKPHLLQNVAMVQAGINSRPGQSAQAEGDEEDESDEEDEADDEGSAEGTVASHRDMRASAKSILQIATQAFDEVGWVPLAKRGSFGRGQYGATQGLNYASPICATWKRRVCTRVVLPAEKLTQYRFTGNLGLHRLQYSELVTFGKLRGTDGADLAFDLSKATLQAKHVPKPGTSVDLVLEAADEGLTHPDQWACLPGICLSKTADKAKRLAVRAEYTGTDGKSYCVKLFTTPRLAQDPGEYTTMGQAIGMLDVCERYYLQKEHITKSDHIFSDLRIMDIKYDNINRTISVQEDCKLPKAYIPKGERSHEEMCDLLRSAGLESIGVPKEFRTASGAGPKRKKCDRCYVHDAIRVGKLQAPVRAPARRGVDCDPVDTGKGAQCDPCKEHGHLCTFTDTQKIGPEIARALWYPAEYPQGKPVVHPLPANHLNPCDENKAEEEDAETGDTTDAPRRGSASSMMSLRSRHGSVGSAGEERTPASPVIGQRFHEIPAYSGPRIRELSDLGTLEALTEIAQMVSKKILQEKDMKQAEVLKSWVHLRRVRKLVDSHLAKGDSSRPKEWEKLREFTKERDADPGLVYTSPYFKSKEGQPVKNRLPTLTELSDFLTERKHRMTSDSFKGTREMMQMLAVAFKVNQSDIKDHLRIISEAEVNVLGGA